MARFLSLDWEKGQLHMVAATIKRGTVSIQRAALWEEEQTPDLANADELGKLLRARLKEAKFPLAPVLACLGRDSVILKELRVPPLAPEEEPNVVRFQAVKEITDAADEVVIDYVPVGAANGMRRILALVVRRDIVETYQRLCAGAGLSLATLMPRSFGMSACIRNVMGTTAMTPPPEPPDSAVAVITVGGHWAEMAILRDASLLLARPLTPGNAMAGEIRRSLAVYAGQSENPPVRALYLSGSPGPELREKLSDMLDLPIHTFDPFAGIDSLHIPPPPRGTFTGAVGALHAQAAVDVPSINFVKPRQARAKKDPNQVRILVGAGLLLLILGVVGFLARMTYVNKQQELTLLQNERKDLDQQLNTLKASNKRIVGLHEWDTPVWLDEIYDLTHRVPDIDALRITSLSLEPMTRSKKTLHVARATLKGRLEKGRRPLDQLIKEFVKDGSYSVQPPQISGESFTLVVLVEKRGPASYERSLEPEFDPRFDPEFDPLFDPNFDPNFNPDADEGDRRRSE